jgi:hypothetical protein
MRPSCVPQFLSGVPTWVPYDRDVERTVVPSSLTASVSKAGRKNSKSLMVKTRTDMSCGVSGCIITKKQKENVYKPAFFSAAVRKKSCFFGFCFF